ncbi:MAG: hypothetical protein QOE13_1510 [Gaiellaceae bacterium]|jgi:hypothetical protein|nr:hypothetical protein [Gaiellaceae bacterium]
MPRRILIGAGLALWAALVVVVGAAGSRSAAPAATPIPVLPSPADFVARIDNKYFPLRPGTTLLFRGTQEGKARRVSVFVTHRTKLILGIRATVVLDQVLVAGKSEEKTFDWYAQDKHGNVWYLGESSSDFVNGKWVRSDGSWEAGVRGAKAGIVMKANPRIGDVYRQEYYAGHAEDMAKVLSRSQSVTVPYGSFEGALETSEWSPLEPGVVERKYYVKGIGNVRTIMVKGGSEEERLVSIKR